MRNKLTRFSSGQQVVERLNSLLDGKGNNIGLITLTASTTSTVKKDKRVGASSTITFMPLTAAAATELGAGNMYFSETATGQFTVTHTNTTDTDKTFRYEVTG